MSDLSPIARLDRRHLVQLLLAGGAALALAGCAGGGSQIQIYVLKPDLQKNPPNAPVKWTLSIATPYATANLNIDRIALSRSASTMDYFADSAWTDRLPVILQNCMVESFESSGRIAAVSRDSAGLRSDYTLETEIRDFAAHYESTDSAPDVVVAITVKLVALPDRTIVGTFDSSQHAQASENKVPAIVAAFNTALTAALKQVVDWTLATAPAVPGATPATGAKPAHRKRRRWRRRTTSTTTTTDTPTDTGAPE